METTVFLAVLTLFGTIVAGLFKLVNDSNKNNASLAKSLDDNTKSNREIAEATKKSAREAKERNGHLADLAIENTEKLMTALTHIKNQDVAEQHVKHQTIEKGK